MNGAHRLVDALLPSSWPTREGALAAAAIVDAEHGPDALAVLLDSWGSATPAMGALADLLRELRRAVSGTLDPLPAPPRSIA